MRPTYLPGEPVNTSATKKGCDRKRSIFLALATIKRSSSDNSSSPGIAIMS
uniref:ORF50f n=1 Tax=Pinus koraiensis TaxID=88728 RepID=Q85X22_PINKO|nr:ORF50f [Pinus koraiensis]